MLVSTQAVCEYINVEEFDVIAQTYSNDILASVGPIFKLCSFFAEWSAWSDNVMLMFTQGIFEVSIFSWSDTLPSGERLQIYDREHNEWSYPVNKTLQYWLSSCLIHELI